MVGSDVFLILSYNFSLIVKSLIVYEKKNKSKQRTKKSVLMTHIVLILFLIFLCHLDDFCIFLILLICYFCTILTNEKHGTMFSWGMRYTIKLKTSKELKKKVKSNSN